ncbi:MAG TPA: PH domain-containing protein [Arenimonas sp.]|tara:strand:+ start:24198 stop:24716 length:519 start_codon:yes stop_codon:yes gene_type:complete
MNPTDPIAQTFQPFGEDWQSLPPAARKVGAGVGAFSGLVIGIAAAVPFAVAMDIGLAGKAGLGLLVALLPALLFVLIARARWRHTQWRLDPGGLRVRRGIVWHKEILVPRSRVQHLDLERGPIERHFGLATLVVHTAGTRMHALRQSGFLDDDAVALRDALLPETDRHDDSL